MPFCKHCGTETSSDKKFCKSCGKAFAVKSVKCGKCGAECAEGKQFCKVCGSPFSTKKLEKNPPPQQAPAVPAADPPKQPKLTLEKKEKKISLAKPGDSVSRQATTPPVSPVHPDLKTCPSCHAEIEPGKKFCESCGCALDAPLKTSLTKPAIGPFKISSSFSKLATVPLLVLIWGLIAALYFAAPKIGDKSPDFPPSRSPTPPLGEPPASVSGTPPSNPVPRQFPTSNSQETPSEPEKIITSPVVTATPVVLSEIEKGVEEARKPPLPPGPEKEIWGTIDAASGLKLREFPSQNGPKVALMPNLTRIKILSRDGPSETIEEKPGKWYFVKFVDQDGWAFGGMIKIEGETVESGSSREFHPEKKIAPSDSEKNRVEKPSPKPTPKTKPKPKAKETKPREPAKVVSPPPKPDPVESPRISANFQPPREEPKEAPKPAPPPPPKRQLKVSHELQDIVNKANGASKRIW